ncbi:MAG TPA: hypothetical protein VFG14_20470 [Chthoniobacteraceae bacterium]|nr:hypothetical protein [Chthoniobacteraceae bacterium]
MPVRNRKPASVEPDAVIANHWQIKPVAMATLPVPGWECLFGRNDCQMRDLTFWVWILRRGDTIGLIDTGLPTGADLDSLNRANQQVDPQCLFTVHRNLDDLLQSEGILPEAVQFALISQMVTYSTGGLTRENLPNARVYCAWEGMRELLTRKPNHPPREFYLTGQSWLYFHELLVEDRLVFAEEAVEVAPGVIFEPTGGHHPGSAGVRIGTARGSIGILETAFVQTNIEQEIPIGIAEDAARCREAIRTYNRECDFTIAGHEPAAERLLAEFMGTRNLPDSRVQ